MPEQGLTRPEKELIAATVRSHGLRTVLFIGGEPTLYIPDMNEMVSLFGEPVPKIRMTTNGHFAGTRTKAKKVLSSISKLSGINLSYDKLHARFLPEENIEALCSACKELGVKFDVLLTVNSPMDMVLVKDLRRLGDFPILIQKLIPVGMAKQNNLGYRYPSFDEKVLEISCPMKDKLTYICGQGFSSCCGSLIYGLKSSGFVHPTVEELAASDFYRLISTHTFSGIIREFGLSGMEMLPEYSTPCVLCEAIFREKERRMC
jgi:hypothetical protein